MKLPESARIAAEAARPVRNPEYIAYLGTAYWQSVRLSVVVRADGRCEMCEEARDTFEVHHLWYPERYKEKLEYLIALCPPCHLVADSLGRADSYTWIEKMRRKPHGS